ncbi:MAG: YdeI/OmpD-associated family protein [Cryomorphaceae bacterium]
MISDDIEHFCPANAQEWRDWLSAHHEQHSAVWLVIFKKNAPTTNLTWNDAVDEALCFGWIDSTRRSVDDLRFKQYFGKRKTNSAWSRINKEKIEQLSQKGAMTTAGLKSVEVAKQNGSWTRLDSVENLEIPPDLEEAFAESPTSKAHFLALSKSARKILLHSIVMAKRPETRHKRIAEVVRKSLEGGQ